MESFEINFAHATRKRYACSNCWGELELVPDMRERGKYFVTCRRCKDETRGYVTQYFVNRRRGESESEKREVDRMMINIGIFQKPYYGTREQMLKDLGF